MIVKGHTALSTPFDPTGSALLSTDVDAAIKEVANLALSSSKGFIFSQYGGNANTGRYLEIFSGIDTGKAPVRVISPFKGITIVARSTAASTGTIKILDIKVPASPIILYTVTFTAQLEVINAGTPVVPLFTSVANAELAIQVGSGSISKPHIYIVGQGG